MKVKIKDIMTVQTGVYLKETPGNKIRYLQVKHFDNTGQYLDAFPTIALNSKVEKYLLSDGDLLFAAKGFANFCAVYNKEWGEAMASSSFLVLKIKNKSKILPEFLAWTLNRNDILVEFRIQTAGSVMPSVTKVMLEELEIEVPAIDRQQIVISIARLQRRERELRDKIADLRNNLVNDLLINKLKI
jgi:restriction endonuclease S subunit